MNEWTRFKLNCHSKSVTLCKCPSHPKSSKVKKNLLKRKDDSESSFYH